MSTRRSTRLPRSPTLQCYVAYPVPYELRQMLELDIPIPIFIHQTFEQLRNRYAEFEVKRRSPQITIGTCMTLLESSISYEVIITKTESFVFMSDVKAS